MPEKEQSFGPGNGVTIPAHTPPMTPVEILRAQIEAIRSAVNAVESLDADPQARINAIRLIVNVQCDAAVAMCDSVSGRAAQMQAMQRAAQEEARRRSTRIETFDGPIPFNRQEHGHPAQRPPGLHVDDQGDVHKSPER